MSTINAHCWVDGCRACGPDAVAGAVCPLEDFGAVEAADSVRIVKVCAANGLTIDDAAARDAWGRHSADMFAGWLYLPADDGALWRCVQPWVMPTAPVVDASEQARRDRVTAAIVKFQRKPAAPPRRWGRR
jgi:hypothetical protein